MHSVVSDYCAKIVDFIIFISLESGYNGVLEACVGIFEKKLGQTDRSDSVQFSEVCRFS